MKRSYIFCTILVALVFVITVSVSFAQDEKNKKVIHSHTDSKGFQRDLTEVDLMYQTAKQYISAGLYDKAIPELERVVDADSTRIEAWQELASCHNKLKAYDKAASALSRAHNQKPDDQYILSTLGYAQLNAKQFNEAMVTYNRMLALDSLSYDANVHLAFLYQGMKDQKKAVRYYEKALLGKSDDIQTMGSLAKIYGEMGEKEKSVAMYEKAVAIAPDNIVLKSRLGASYITDQKFDKAAVIFASLVELRPDVAAYHQNLGISYGQIKRIDEAIIALEKTIELKPDASSAYQQLAQMYNDKNQYNKAIQVVQEGIKHTDKPAGLYCVWGKSLEKLKRFDEAVGKYQKAANDPQWGSYAKKEIARQAKLKEREQRIKEKESYE